MDSLARDPESTFHGLNSLPRQRNLRYICCAALIAFNVSADFNDHHNGFQGLGSASG